MFAKLTNFEKKIVIGLSVVVTAAIIGMIASSHGTSAYFSDVSETKNNVITLGNVKTHIDEGNVSVSRTVINKAPYVVNDGKNSCLVRVRINVSPSNLLDKMTFDYNENWYDGEDGYYYYKNILPVSEKTEPVFTKITGLTDENGNFTGDIFGNEFSINVYQEAIQTVIYSNNGKVEYHDEGQYDEVKIKNIKLLWEQYKAQQQKAQ